MFRYKAVRGRHKHVENATVRTHLFFFLGGGGGGGGGGGTGSVDGERDGQRVK